MSALITGATGFVGSRLLQELDGAHVLSRSPERAQQRLGAGVKAFAWDGQSEFPAASLQGVDTVYHLAGEPVAQRWNKAVRQKIRDSRVASTERIVAALAQADTPVRTLVCASAIGYYGDRGEEALTEDSKPGTGFLPEVCREWEQAAAKAEQHGIRVVSLRIGIVLGPGGGALKKMLPPFKLGFGGRLGSGRQWMSWIHRDDVVGMLLHAARDEALHGPMNGVAPNPDRNVDFTKTLGRVLKRPTILPLPAFGLRLAAGDFAEVLLASQQVLPEVARKSDYRFHYPELEAALRDCLR